MFMGTTTKNNGLPIIRGNLFDYIVDPIYLKNNGSSIIVPHVCNNANLFGAGFAAAVAKNYPSVKENYHLLGSKFLKNNLGHTQFISVLHDKTYNHQLIFANMISQNNIISHSNRRPLNYLALCRSMASIAQYIKSNFQDQRAQIHCPKFGCGLAGGNWNFIEELIKDIWGDLTVFIYDNK
ncbi:MAG: hypothetical protein EBZ62_00340 [Sphingobacteriia bacterium]|nr:hypothetical protein [Sphingobacteriia bacterium]